MFEYFLGIILVVTTYFIITHVKDPRLPPGIYGWPIIGSLPSFKVPLTDQVEKYRKQFGDIFLWRIGTRNNVYICCPKIIKKAFANPDLTDRPLNFFTFDSWSYFKKTGIVNNNGVAWQVHRRFALRHLRDSGFGKSIVEDIIHLEAESLIDDLKANYLNTPVDVPSSINAATLNVIWKLTADIRFERDDEDLQKFMGFLTDLIRQIQGLVNIFDVFPWLVPFTPKFLMNKTGFAELQKTRKVIKDYLKSIVEKRKASLNKENPCGLIDFYLLEMENNNSDKLFDEDALIISLGDLFFAGTDTTASTIRWTLQHMACYPEIQKRVQKEIDSVVPRDKLPSISDKPRLPYTEAAVHEILRISSNAPFGVFHAAREDTMIEQYFIPKGTVIQPFLYGCHMDPNYWEKPNEFYPEHFLDTNKNFTAKNEAFLPFSCGRRTCLGESLARTELFLFISALLQKFSFQTPEGETVSLERDPKGIIFGIPPKLKLVIREREE